VHCTVLYESIFQYDIIHSLCGVAEQIMLKYLRYNKILQTDYQIMSLKEGGLKFYRWDICCTGVRQFAFLNETGKFILVRAKYKRAYKAYDICETVQSVYTKKNI